MSFFEHEVLQEIIKEYAQHQSWRCEYQSRFPWEPDCHCGLTASLREAGLPPEWASVQDPEAKGPMTVYDYEVEVKEGKDEYGRQGN